jgi:hypothetical protein
MKIYSRLSEKYYNFKKIIISFATLIFIFNTDNCISQWQSDVRLTNNNEVSSVRQCRNIAVKGDTVHVVWEDNRDGNYEIYYKRSVDGGVSWSADIRITNDIENSNYPSVHVSASAVHIFWHELNSIHKIQYKRSTDGGYNWSTKTEMANSFYGVYYHSEVSGSVIHLVFTFFASPQPPVIRYKRSQNEGLNWETPVNLSYSGGSTARISSSGQNIVAYWTRDSILQNYIYYKSSPDGGNTWGPDIRMTDITAKPSSPSLSISGTSLQCVWQDIRDGNCEIYYKRSLNNGLNWEADLRLTNYSDSSIYPNIEISGSAVHLFWQDKREGNFEIYYKRSVDNGNTWESDYRLTNDIAFSGNPSSYVSGAKVHIVWDDTRNANYEVYYKCNPTGNPVGIYNISAEIPENFRLYQNYPNPFNPSTKIRFDIYETSVIKIKIFDASGREIETLVNRNLNPGTYEVDWDASENSGGVYFCRFISENYIETKKLILLK